MNRGRPKRDTEGLSYSQWYYLNVRLKQRRASRRKDMDARCFFCSVLLSSLYGSKYGRRYCDGCRNSRRVKRHLNNIYQKRAYAIRTGKEKSILITTIPE